MRTLSSSSIRLPITAGVFYKCRGESLMAVNFADVDPNCVLLDRRAISDFLDFDKYICEAVRQLSAK